MSDDQPLHVHAGAVVVGEAGVLIEGASGTGKSRLALALLTLATGQGRFAALVGDDRIALSAHHGRLVARPHPALAGLIERRGTGLLHLPHEPACVVRLVVGLMRREDLPERHPAAPPVRTLMGVALPWLCLAAPEGAEGHALQVLSRLVLPFGDA